MLKMKLIFALLLVVASTLLATECVRFRLNDDKRLIYCNKRCRYEPKCVENCLQMLTHRFKRRLVPSKKTAPRVTDRQCITACESSYQDFESCFETCKSSRKLPNTMYPYNY